MPAIGAGLIRRAEEIQRFQPRLTRRNADFLAAKYTNCSTAKRRKELEQEEAEMGCASRGFIFGLSVLNFFKPLTVMDKREFAPRCFRFYPGSPHPINPTGQTPLNRSGKRSRFLFSNWLMFYQG